MTMGRAAREDYEKWEREENERRRRKLAEIGLTYDTNQTKYYEWLRSEIEIAAPGIRRMHPYPNVWCKLGEGK